MMSPIQGPKVTPLDNWLRMQRSGMSENVETAARLQVAGPLGPVRRFWSGDWLPERRLLAAACLVLFVAAMAAATGAIHARLYGHDTFFLLDNGWRALHGQRAHVDYSSPLGPLTYLLVAAGLAISGGSVAAVSYANALAASAVGLWAAWLAAARSRTVTAIAFPCFAALLVAAPFALGDVPVWTSHGMVYNRYGDALVMIVLLECFQPGDESPPRHRRLGEPVLTGCAIGLLLFLKITYFLVALPLVGMSLVFWNRRGPRALACAIGFTATALAFLAYLRWDLAAMANDLLEVGAARSRSLGVRLGILDILPWAFLQATLLAVLALGCAKLSGKRGADARPAWQAYRYPLAALAVAGTDVLLLLTNAQSVSFPLVAAFAVVLLFSIDPALRSSAPAGPGKTASLLLLLAGLLAGPAILVQSVGMICGFVEARVNPMPDLVLRFESPRLRPLVLYDPAPGEIDKYSNGREYVASINDGMRLLAAHTLPNEKVTTLDIYNPFAYALGREPIRGGVAFALYGYTLDERHHPSPGRFFGDAAVVMVPKFPASLPMFYDGYRRIYQPALEREFRLAAESPRWWLYRRAAQPEASSAPATRSSGGN